MSFCCGYSAKIGEDEGVAHLLNAVVVEECGGGYELHAILYNVEQNFEVLLYIVKDSVKFITTTTLFDHYSIEQMSDTFILAYLRGVSTTKGQQIIEDYIKKNQKTE